MIKNNNLKFNFKKSYYKEIILKNKYYLIKK